jgi:hypothetical protein
MKSDIPLLAFGAWLTLAMGACAEAKPRDLKPRDLTPVSWKKAKAHPPVEIARSGKARAVVYLADPNPSATLKRLVGEMVEVIRLSTGATLKLVAEAPPADRPAIVIGDCAETRLAGIAAAKIPIEGFVVKTAANRVYLVGSTRKLPAGSTRWASWSNDGSAWAVADFLERFVGVRWYWPAELGGRTIIPAGSLVIPPAHYSDHPVFRLREYYPAYGWKLPAKARSSDKVPLAFPKGAIPEDVAKIPMDTFLPLVRQGCSWPYKIKVHQPQHPPRRPPEGWTADAHKQLLALKKDGTRDPKMFCYSSPKTLEYLLDGCERAWDKGKGCPWVTSTCVTVSPPDRPVDCCCGACKETRAKADDFFEKDSIHWFRGPSLTMALFAKRMCQAVKKRWPDKKVIYLPYWNYQECPTKLDFPDNLVIQVAMTTWPMPLRAQDEIRQGAIGTLRAWRSKACMPVTVWDYSVGWTYGPYQFPHVVRDFYPKVKDIVAGVFINGENLGEWTNTAPTLYVWMKSMWNPNLDVDVVLDEMCRRLFGKASGTVREMVRIECDLWEKGAWRTSRVKVPGGWFVPKRLFGMAWTPDRVQKLKALHKKALSELVDDPAAKQRFAYWTWTFDAFVKDAEATGKAKRTR